MSLASDLLSIANSAASETMELLLDRVDGSLDVTQKSTTTDLVTQVDREAEALIVGVIKAERPDDGIVGEEGTGVTGSSGVNWIIDPIDGTTNFVYGHPGFAVSIAAEIDETDRFPLELVKLFGEMGLMQLWVPERYDGPNGNLTMACIAREEISKVSPAWLRSTTLSWKCMYSPMISKSVPRISSVTCSKPFFCSWSLNAPEPRPTHCTMLSTE